MRSAPAWLATLAGMPVSRLMPDELGDDLIALVRQIADKASCDRASTRPRQRVARGAELPGRHLHHARARPACCLPYAEEFGGGAQPHETHLRVVEEIGSAWMSVAVGTSCTPSRAIPSPRMAAQNSRPSVPAMLSGETLRAYCLRAALRLRHRVHDDARRR